MKQLLLLGAGHAHAQVLKAWAAAPLPGVQLTVISPSALAPYSGMVPGWLAGTYRFEEICIDFATLSRAAGAQLRIDEVVAIDASTRSVHLASGARCGWDWLSLNVGSTLVPPSGLAATVLALRPLGRLHSAWAALLQQQAGQTAPLRITTVGGGAAGVESLLAALARLRAQQPGRVVTGRLFTSSALLPGLAPGAVREAHQALRRAGVAVHTETPFDPAQASAGEILLWATGAQPHAWQRGSGMATRSGGFFEVDAHLQSTSHPGVFAVGDCAHFHPPLPKAGVYAVRMGPVLTHNLRAAITGSPWARYTPQHRTLALLATADGRAIAARGRLSLHGPRLGRWAWRWKDHIDRGFLARFAAPPAR
jgi:pyridine nucleotide-disulfide oxidoreductase family protein